MKFEKVTYHRVLPDAFRPAPRKGAAVVEFALVLPIFLTIFVATVDLTRAFYSTQVIAHGARTAAQFAANSDLAASTKYDSTLELAMKCVQDLKPLPTIKIDYGTDQDSNKYVEVAVSQEFSLLFPYTFRTNYELTRSARARLNPNAWDSLNEER